MDVTRFLGQPFLDESSSLPLDRPFTARTAYDEAGLTWRELAWLVSHGFLRHPIRDVYVAAQLQDSIRLRCECLRLVVPADAVVVDRHAGWLHGATMVLAPGEHLKLQPISIFLPAGRGRLRNPLSDSGERTLRPDDVVELEGLRMTTPIRTAWDLGRHRWPERSLAAMDQMLRLGAFTREQLIAGVERFRGMRWVRTLRVTAQYVDGRAESPPESVLRLRWIEVGLPTPQPQLEVWADGQFLARLDLANEMLRFAAEYDGAEWHSSPEQLEHDRDRRRDVEEHDWLVQPFTKDNVFGRAENAHQLLVAGVDEARRRFGIRLPH